MKRFAIMLVLGLSLIGVAQLCSISYRNGVAAGAAWCSETDDIVIQPRLMRASTH